MVDLLGRIMCKLNRHEDKITSIRVDTVMAIGSVMIKSSESEHPENHQHIITKCSRKGCTKTKMFLNFNVSVSFSGRQEKV